MQRIIFIALYAVLGLTVNSHGQSTTIRVLFLGNSYTEVNNLPQTLANMANSTGDTLIFDSNTPGGQTLSGHSNDATSLSKIASGNWDFVVLQEQSQYPSFPISQVENSVFPYALILDSIINVYNPCAETVFYITWGRKNGDAQNCPYWPPICTYNGMDSLLTLRYSMMAEDNNAILSPVGPVWKYIRTNFPSIELYQTDESHPSLAGTYAAACCFYTTLFRKDPSLITYNANLLPEYAANIRAAVKTVVYDSLKKWKIGEFEPQSDFTYTDLGSNNIAFTNESLNATSYLWLFGDGDTSTLQNPTHNYSTEGVYGVKLFAYKCELLDSTEQTITIKASGIKEQNSHAFNIYPNPTATTFTLTADSRFYGIDYKIYNVEGKNILSGKIKSEQTIIDLTDFSRGLYIIKINDDLRHKLKVVKE